MDFKDERFLFISTTNHIIQIDFKVNNYVNEFLDKIVDELESKCQPFEKIEKIMVCENELKNW